MAASSAPQSKSELTNEGREMEICPFLLSGHGEDFLMFTNGYLLAKGMAIRGAVVLKRAMIHCNAGIGTAAVIVAVIAAP